MSNGFKVVPRVLTLAAALALLVPLAWVAPARADHDPGQCIKACAEARKTCERQCEDRCEAQFPRKSKERKECERSCREGCKQEFQACRDRCDDDVSPHKP